MVLSRQRKARQSKSGAKRHRSAFRVLRRTTSPCRLISTGKLTLPPACRGPPGGRLRSRGAILDSARWTCHRPWRARSRLGSIGSRYRPAERMKSGHGHFSPLFEQSAQAPQFRTGNFSPIRDLPCSSKSVPHTRIPGTAPLPAPGSARGPAWPRRFVRRPPGWPLSGSRRRARRPAPGATGRPPAFAPRGGRGFRRSARRTPPRSWTTRNSSP